MEHLHIFFKAAAAFFSLWALTRFLGKQQIGQLTLFDYITGISLGSLAAAVVVEPEWTHPLIGLVTFSALVYLMHLLELQGRTINRIADGAPTVVIRSGQILEKALQKEKLTLGHIMSLLRQRGYFDVRAVEFALLETDGTLSVLPRSQYRPVQPRDLGLHPPHEGPMIQVMHEGKPIPHGLSQAGLSDQWLEAELARKQVDPKQVFAAWINSQGQLELDPYHKPGEIQ